MNTLAYSLDEMLPESYRDGSFDLEIRDAHSVAVFWDLPETNQPPHSGARLCLSYTNAAGETDTLILHHEAGHVLVPLHGEGRWYRFTLGWSDGESFQRIASASAELPAVIATNREVSSGSRFDYRGSLFMPLAMPVERRGFRPPPEV